MSKLTLNDVTLVSVTGVNFEKTLFALWQSSREIDFAAVKLITPVELDLPAWVSNEESIGSRLDSIDAYNHYMLYDLHKHVETNFVLVVQADGYVIRPRLWSSRFLDYDYVGAPWKLSKTAYIDPFGSHQRVGNGGFSLRSQRILETPQKLDIPFDVNSSDFYNHANANLRSEDGNICVHNRHLFERRGCTFADVETAALFSREQWVPERRFRSTFGFHKKMPLRLLIQQREAQRLYRTYRAGKSLP